MILQHLRGSRHSRITTSVMFGFIMLAVGGMVFMDVGGFFRSGGVGSGNVAEIGGEAITIQSFDRTLGTLLSRHGMSRGEAWQAGLVDQVLSSEIRDTLVERAAKDFGISVPEALVAARIEKMLPPPSDGMTKQQALDMALRQQGLSEADFVRMVRREMTVSLVRDAFAAGNARAPESLARSLYAWERETRAADVLFLPDSEPGEAIPTPSDHDLAKFHEASKALYTLPEMRGITLALLAPAKLTEGIDIPEDELRAAYDADPERWKTPERRTLGHSVVKDKAQAGVIADKARGGSALESAVKDVTGKTENYNAPQAFAQDDLSPEIAEPVFAARAGEIVGPLESPMGFHVIAVESIEPARVRGFAEVREELAREARETLAAEKLSELGNAIDDRIAGGGTLEDAAKDFGMSLEKIAPATAQGLGPDGTDLLKPFDADRAALMESAFALGQGETAPVAELSDGRYVLLRVDTVTSETVKPVEEVREDLKKKWMAREARLANRKRAEAIFKAVSSGERTLAAAAASVGLKVKSLSGIERAKPPAEPLSPPALMQLFETTKGKAVSAEGKDGLIVAVVTDVKLGAPPEGEAGKAALAAAAAAQGGAMAEAAWASWIDHMAKIHDVRVNDRLLRSVYGAADEGEPQP